MVVPQAIIPLTRLFAAADAAELVQLPPAGRVANNLTTMELGTAGVRVLLTRSFFTESETNSARLFSSPNRQPFVKDGINDFIVDGRTEAVNPERVGTKAAAH